MSDNRRIAKNTIALYVRMIIVMLVGLYTSRVVLNTLGVEDYGIYAVVGGPIALFGFLNVAMTASTQRYLNFELGKNNTERLKYVFMTATYVHAIISVVIFLLAETVGLWLLMNKMIIPPERMTATIAAYQISVIGTVIGILCSPYNAAIIAHEKMNAFAYISILDVSLNLIVVYVIQLVSVDKLVLYAALLLVVRLLIRFIYGRYCKRHFEETVYRKLWDKGLMKEMTSFAFWNLWGNMAAVFYGQGINVLLNMFFGPRVNAARSIATTVLGQTTQFAGGFQTAVNPQITKLFAQGELSQMHTLLFRSCKFSFFLILLIALPVFVEAPLLLKLWLKIVPDYTIVFLRISMVIALIDSMARPLMTAAAATGRVKLYQSVIGGILLFIVVVAYIVLKMGGNPTSVYIVQLTLISIAFVVRLFILRPMISLSIGSYLWKVVVVCFGVTFTSSLLSAFAKVSFPAGIPGSILVIFFCVFSVCICCYFLGLDRAERVIVNRRFGGIVKKFRS